MPLPRLLLALAVSAAVAVPDAWAASISGKVVDAASKKTGLPGMCVTANPGSEFITVETGPDGTYVIDDLPPGEYEVFASDCTDPVEYSPVDFKNIRGLNRNKAKLIKLKKETTARKNVNFKMPRAGHIVVQLQTSDGVPISGVTVCPYWFERDKKKNGNIFQSGFCGETEAGEVVLDVTAGGNRIFAFTSGGVYYDGPDARTQDFDDAHVVTVAPDQTVTIVFKPNPTDIAEQ